MDSTSLSSCSLKKSKSSNWGDFTLTGPTHLTTINWSDEYQQCCVAACLVQGIYTLHEKHAGGRKWWESFHFRITQELRDEDGSSIIGAIFLYTGPSDASAPSIAIAFRGTATTQDWKMNYRASVNELHETSRFQHAMEAVELAASQGSSMGRRIWLCGHSLGAALAMLVGKRMAKVGVYLDTFLFNPPFVLRKGGRILNCTAFGLVAVLSPPLLLLPLAVKYALRQRETSIAMQSIEAQQSFANLCSWVPRLFVNPGDFICSDYIKHLEKRKQRGRRPQPTAEELEHPFLIPSAKLVKNLCTFKKKAIDKVHGLSQWWKAELKLQSKDYIRALPSP
ncbi:GDSL esterase/lipase [Nymphaea thermarum]|nr:GDSL esterase/lipase [Nymphaea thermarum]